MLRCARSAFPAAGRCSYDLTLKGPCLTRLHMKKAKRRCPNCERSVSLWNLRCGVCHYKLTAMYVLIALLVLAAATGIALVMDSC
jgi:hypothetical protein